LFDNKTHFLMSSIRIFWWHILSIPVVITMAQLEVSFGNGTNLTEYAALDRAPDEFQVILETNVDNGAACPIVLNVTRSLAPNCTDLFWSLLIPPPAIFQNSAFFRVVSGSFVNFGVSGVPSQNSLDRLTSSHLQSDEPMVLNSIGMVSFSAFPDGETGPQLVINLGANQDFDIRQLAPFAQVNTPFQPWLTNPSPSI
jgi:hypothetical protein